MKRYSFSKREKVLLVVLAILLVGALWYLLVYQGTQTRTQQAQQELESAQATLSTQEDQLASMTTMQKELDSLKSSGTAVPLPDYDNQSNVLAELNTILGSVNTYSLSFAEPAVDDNGIVRRTVTLSFGCADYATARATLDAIEASQYRNQIQTCAISSSGSTSTSTNSIVASRSTVTSTSTASYTVSVTVIYCEKA